MKNTYLSLLILALSIFASSCKKYLDAKPDKSLVIPESLNDLQALLDNDQTINRQDPIAGDVGCDDYYINASFLPNISTLFQGVYNWNPGVRFDADWQNNYTKIYMANTVLDNIDRVSESNRESSYSSIKGAAYFVRGWSLFSAAQIYTVPFENGKNDESLGMPFKKTSDINDPTVRSTLKNTYDWIANDLKAACQYLPAINSPATRPSKAAAYAALACVYLQMQEWKLAESYADSSLKIENTLLDFNTLDSNSRTPITNGNIEMLYQSRLTYTTVFSTTGCRVDSLLYLSYQQNDLRKNIFYQANVDGTHYFKGQYDGNTSQTLFSGISVDEMYLIKAECAARLNDLKEASSILNGLLVKRYKSGSFQPYNFIEQVEALTTILHERRKELAFRGNRRWWDLRRLNLEPAFAITIKRSIDGTISELPPNDLRYALLIPESAVTLSGAQQNAR
ncbi:Starch-binding associating with outer membrane [bacterium A37T11]|nr:Starch-binding associating with outer membrane [bacterium A37T11]